MRHVLLVDFLVPLGFLQARKPARDSYKTATAAASQGSLHVLFLPTFLARSVCVHLAVQIPTRSICMAALDMVLDGRRNNQEDTVSIE